MCVYFSSGFVVSLCDCEGYMQNCYAAYGQGSAGTIFSWAISQKQNLQFDSSTGHDQPSDPVLTILYGSARLAVWLGFSGVFGSSDVPVCLVDDSSGECM